MEKFLQSRPLSKVVYCQSRWLGQQAARVEMMLNQDIQDILED
jgi:hypothetical protein